MDPAAFPEGVPPNFGIPMSFGKQAGFHSRGGGRGGHHGGGDRGGHHGGGHRGGGRGGYHGGGRGRGRGRGGGRGGRGRGGGFHGRRDAPPSVPLAPEQRGYWFKDIEEVLAAVPEDQRPQAPALAIKEERPIELPLGPNCRKSFIENPWRRLEEIQAMQCIVKKD